MKEEVVISLKNINKTFYVRENAPRTMNDHIYSVFRKNVKKKKIEALKNINLDIHKGEVIGIIGRNGSGKSTLLNIMLGSIIPDNGGKVSSKGKIMRLALGMGVDPNLSARDNIYVNGSIIGLTFKKIGSLVDTIIEFAGLEGFLDTPVKFYSKGMKARLLFSIAMNAESDIFLLDEFFGGVGDEDFKKKSDLAFKEKIMQKRTIVIVSHSMKIIEKYCSRVLFIKEGHPIALGDTKAVIETYMESYKTAKK